MYAQDTAHSPPKLHCGRMLANCTHAGMYVKHIRNWLMPTWVVVVGILVCRHNWHYSETRAQLAEANRLGLCNCCHTAFTIPLAFPIKYLPRARRSTSTQTTTTTTTNALPIKQHRDSIVKCTYTQFIRVCIAIATDNCIIVAVERPFRIDFDANTHVPVHSVHYSAALWLFKCPYRSNERTTTMTKNARLHWLCTSSAYHIHHDVLVRVHSDRMDTGVVCMCKSTSHMWAKRTLWVRMLSAWIIETQTRSHLDDARVHEHSPHSVTFAFIQYTAQTELTHSGIDSKRALCVCVCVCSQCVRAATIMYYRMCSNNIAKCNYWYWKLNHDIRSKVLLRYVGINEYDAHGPGMNALREITHAPRATCVCVWLPSSVQTFMCVFDECSRVGWFSGSTHRCKQAAWCVFGSCVRVWHTTNANDCWNCISMRHRQRYTIVVTIFGWNYGVCSWLDLVFPTDSQYLSSTRVDLRLIE